MSLEKRASSQRTAPEASASAREEVGRKQVSEIQRARIVAAMIAVASEHGLGHATVARVVARSGVSRRTFYEQFADREECFIAAFDQCVERVAAVVLPAYRQPSKWQERVRGGLTALLELLDLEPDVAQLTVVETLGAGHDALERRRRAIVQISAVIDREGREAAAGEDPPPLMAEGVVGGVLSLIHTRIVDRGHSPLIELLNPLVSMVVLAYRGPAAARRELERAVPSSRNGAGRVGSDPLRDLHMRLTYRTVRVLLAIGELGGQGPHPSNRQVGDAAGIRDQGQVSKLLVRLQQLGLVENAGDAQAKGEPNKWVLTKRGAEVREVLSV